MPDHQDRNSPLDELARATDDLRPANAVVDAVMERVTASAASSSPESLQTLAALTDELCPADGFADEVMRRVHAVGAPRQAGGWFSAEGMVRSGRAALLVAAAVAAGFLVYGSYAERLLYGESMASVAPVEASE